jgi:hypothetical protein
MFCQGGEIIGTSAIFLARFHLALSPGIRLVLDYFRNDIGLDVIILPFTLRNAVLEPSLFVQKEAVNSWFFACTPITRDPTDYTNFRLRLSPEPAVGNIN